MHPPGRLPILDFAKADLLVKLEAAIGRAESDVGRRHRVQEECVLTVRISWRKTSPEFQITSPLSLGAAGILETQKGAFVRDRTVEGDIF
eukprot:gene9524-biopygen4712